MFRRHLPSRPPRMVRVLVADEIDQVVALLAAIDGSPSARDSFDLPCLAPDQRATFNRLLAILDHHFAGTVTDQDEAMVAALAEGEPS